MAEGTAESAHGAIRPKDVFARSNMPSHWERLTNVAPKTAADRKYVAFVAARYRGDLRLPRPDEVDPPDEIHTRQRTQVSGWCAAAAAAVFAVIGAASEVSAFTVTGVALFLIVVGGVAVVYLSTQDAVNDFHAYRALCERAESRLHVDPMDSEDTSTANTMITCDEGTLAYCAAKIASEIEQIPLWASSRLYIVPIDLRDELAEIGASARQIAEDRQALAALESSRLRDDADIRSTVAEDRQQMTEALGDLAARVHALADYRDEAQRLSVAARRDTTALNRAVRRAADQEAAKRLR
ncbi:hypothetical protein [Mycobacterium sp. IDR2000157661]|uniref:hypothetical protein n=1 Tax=Mycobacterium sp. IDR2000157661 TaxID=2867005 RepID=UPI001EE9CC25|nr:hypothetical protein [Mycobacterium sp. IDR2000157661]ULE34043.1 hypothetical protein K3G64_05045 [Mycobacterium sp. IDR2000157661]